MPLRKDSSSMLSFGTARIGADDDLIAVLRILKAAPDAFSLAGGGVMTVCMQKRIPQ